MEAIMMEGSSGIVGGGKIGRKHSRDVCAGNRREQRLDHCIGTGRTCVGTCGMETPALHELLDRLHTELQAAHPLGAEDRALLRAVQEDIGRLLAPASGEIAPADPAVHEETRSRVQEAAARLAGSHPRLAGALGDMFNALSNAGL
jgi:hypothetical protein